MTRPGTKVIGTFIDALDWDSCVSKLIEWGNKKNSKTVCLCNAHSSVTATEDPRLAYALSQSDMVLPDGAPVAWMLRRKGYPNQTRIAGPDLMTKLCEQLQTSSVSIFLFGSTEETLEKLHQKLVRRFPGLVISGKMSPRFGQWSDDEEQQYIDIINRSGAGIIFIGLGCPKQEIWMAANRNKVMGVMLGVGAAFDFHAGKINRAPQIIQMMGLEWLHRLISEPRRLWHRYLTTNTRFIYLALSDLIKSNLNAR